MTAIDPTEFEKAKAWRVRRELSPAQLGEAIGYSVEVIYLMERGAGPQATGRPRTNAGRTIKPWTWLRYKRACGDLDAELYGRKQGTTFQW